MGEIRAKGRAINSGKGIPQRKVFKHLPWILLDPGHGGMINGVYQTSGKRSPEWPDGRQLFEGVFNRKVVAELIQLLHIAGYPYYDIVNSEEDVPLKERTRRASDFYYNDTDDCILISIHANAGGGTGYEVFTSPGETSADPMAEIMLDAFADQFPELRMRTDKSDGDNDKEAKFYMIVNTPMPAMLIECAFMDTLHPDCELMLSDNGPKQFAQAIYDGIYRIYKALENGTL